MAVVMAIDAGTTGVRSFAIDESGRRVGSSYREFAQYFPAPGWVEHDPLEIWSAVQSTLAELTSALDEPVAAIGITDQRETTVVWDRSTGRPLAPAIVWQDRRTAGRCEELEESGVLPLIRDRTGLVLDPYFSATKLEWLLGPGGVEAGADLAFGTVDSWLAWCLTAGQVHVTDTSNASRTLLFDIRRLRWDEELLDVFGVPASALPEIRPSSGRIGVTGSECAAGSGIPISGVAGDQQAALFGQACFEPGMSKNTYGTGSFVLMNTGHSCPEPAEGLLTTVAWTIPSNARQVTNYALEGAIFVTGAAIQWLRDGLKMIDSAAETGPLAESCPDTEGVYFVPAFTGLGSPHWDPYARGTVVGITRGVGRAHLARAVVESMAYQTRDVVEAMSTAAARPIGELRVDGGASVMDLLLQIQADQLGVPVTRPLHQETTAMGAAYLAGLAEGVWTLDDIAANWQADLRVEPDPDEGTEERYRQWQRAVQRSRDWARR
ncbi:MAG: Glycerol kinase [Acidimicrobiales bacterium]|nr:MAG: glycerol kinase [Actinomycetota bacterium]MBV6508784.1 Glycerol kinase [Acidimicrobiales bacterium]RIK03648.1 MAG: glycerol kinase [Acidobacteriota bacterium]